MVNVAWPCNYTSLFATPLRPLHILATLKLLDEAPTCQKTMRIWAMWVQSEPENSGIMARWVDLSGAAHLGLRSAANFHPGASNFHVPAMGNEAASSMHYSPDFAAIARIEVSFKNTSRGAKS